VVAQFGIGLGVALGIEADRRGLVALGQGGENSLPDGRGQLQTGLSQALVEEGRELDRSV
jgi:hypothetical protein